MPFLSRSVQSLFPASTVQGLIGTVTSNLTATGSAQASALPVSDCINIVTNAAASTGVAVFPFVSNYTAGDSQMVVNYGANTLTVYPPVGYKINNGSTNAGVSVAAGKSAQFFLLDTTNIAAIISA